MRSKPPSLFPELDREDAENRSASAREAAQRVRNDKRKAVEYLRGRDVTWLIDKLVDDGPTTDVMLTFIEAEDLSLEEAGRVWVDRWFDIWSLWRIGKLWRVSQGIHPGAGEEYFLYGIRGVHPRP